jgi:hypothetical protein
MLKDQTMQPTLLQEDFHANLSALQEKEREQMMIATSGMKLLESLPNVNRAGLLGKMLKDLLTSTTAWSSDRCKLIWKIKVSKSNVLLFQLQASVHGIKGKESGLWLTPTATEMGARIRGSSTERGKNTGPNDREEHSSTRKFSGASSLWNGNNEYVPNSEQQEITRREGNNKQLTVRDDRTLGLLLLRKKNKPEMTFGAKLSDAMLYLNKTKPGGKLSPNFVEFLMGYPQHWTKIDPTE